MPAAVASELRESMPHTPPPPEIMARYWQIEEEGHQRRPPIMFPLGRRPSLRLTPPPLKATATCGVELVDDEELSERLSVEADMLLAERNWRKREGPRRASTCSCSTEERPCNPAQTQWHMRSRSDHRTFQRRLTVETRTKAVSAGQSTL